LAELEVISPTKWQSLFHFSRFTEQSSAGQFSIVYQKQIDSKKINTQIQCVFNVLKNLISTYRLQENKRFPDDESRLTRTPVHAIFPVLIAGFHVIIYSLIMRWQ
jgi:hypothetical protein